MPSPSYIENVPGVATSGTSVTIDYDAFSAINAGDDLVLFVGVDRDNATGINASGFTSFEDVFGSSGSQSVTGALLHRIADGSESGNLTVNLGSGNDGISAVLLRYSGGDGTTTPLSDSSAEGRVSNPSAPALTPPAGDWVIINCVVQSSNANSYTSSPGSLTNRYNAGSNGTAIMVAVADEEVAADGSTAYGGDSWTLTSSRNAVAFSFAIKGAAGGGPVTVELSPADIQHDQALEEAGLNKNVVSAPEGMQQGQTIEAPAVDKSVQSSPADMQHDQALEPASVSVAFSLPPEALSHVQTIAPFILNRSGALAPDELQHAHTIAEPSVGGLDLSNFKPVAGYSAYEWQEGAAWIEVDIVADLGLSEASADIGPAIKTHMDDNRDDRIIYTIPAGTFNLITLLHFNRDEKRIKGAGSGSSIINVSGSGVIRFQGFDGGTSAVQVAPSRGDTTVEVADASIAAVGETITIRQDLGDTVTGTDDNTSPYAVGTITPESWAAQAWEQIVEVTAVDETNDIITFTPALALDYDLAENPEVKRYNNVFDAGIEGVTLNVTEDNGLVAIQFDRVRQCYARDVKIYNHAKMGIQITESFEVEIDACVVDGARDTGTGGNGYGYCIELGSARVYLHDSKAKDQRHAYLIQAGASHNIVAYNWSASPSVEDLTDLSLHGHYIHHNLIEGNVFQGTVEINDFYTETNHNIVYRNRILGNPNFWDAASRPFSFWVRRNSVVALIGNRCETTSVLRLFDGSEASVDHKNGNSDTDAGLDDSCYLTARPAHWAPQFVWPPFAGDTSNQIPAELLDLPVIELSPADLQAASTIAPGGIFKSIGVGAEDLGSPHVLEDLTITRALQASAEDLVSPHTIEEPNIAIEVELQINPEDLVHGQTIAAPAIARVTATSPEDLQAPATIAPGEITRALQASPEDLVSPHTIDEASVVLEVEIQINPEALSHGQTISASGITRRLQIAPAELASGLTIADVAIARALQVTPDELQAGHTIDEPALSVTSVIEINPEGLSHGSTVSAVLIERRLSFAAEPLNHLHLTEPALLSRLLDVSPESIQHIHTIDDCRVIVGVEAFTDDPFKVVENRHFVVHKEARIFRVVETRTFKA